MRKIIGLLALAFLVSGCATGQLAWRPEERAIITNREFPFAYEKVFDAVLITFEDNGYPIINIDKINGIVNTDYKSAGGAVFGTGKTKLNARITKVEDDVTRVNLSLHCEGYSATLGVPITDDFIDKKHYESWFNTISKRLNQ